MQVLRELFSVDDGALVLAEMTDRTYRIFRDGDMDDRRWHLSRVEDAVKAFIEIEHELKQTSRGRRQRNMHA